MSVRYKLMLNGATLTTGTLLDCYKMLLGVEGPEIVQELVNLGYRIKKDE